MERVSIWFEKIDGVSLDSMRKAKIRPGYDHVDIHVIFDINMGGKFTIKLLLVSDGHTTDPPSSIT